MSIVGQFKSALANDSLIFIEVFVKWDQHVAINEISKVPQNGIINWYGAIEWYP